jgi:hypothetical protein
MIQHQLLPAKYSSNYCQPGTTAGKCDTAAAAPSMIQQLIDMIQQQLLLA